MQNRKWEQTSLYGEQYQGFIVTVLKRHLFPVTRDTATYPWRVDNM